MSRAGLSEGPSLDRNPYHKGALAPTKMLFPLHLQEC